MGRAFRSATVSARAAMIGTMHLLWGPNGVYCRNHEKQREAFRCTNARHPLHDTLEKRAPPTLVGEHDDMLGSEMHGGPDHEKIGDVVVRKAPAAERAICGTWVSSKGECHISHDKLTDRLHYEETFASQDGDQLLKGWLMRRMDVERCWQASLSVSVRGEEDRDLTPETVGDIDVRLGSGRPPSTLHLRIRVANEDEDWQTPVVFHRQHVKAAAAPAQREGRSRRTRGGRGRAA